MTIVLASDHAGYTYKEEIKAFLKGKGHDIVDVGASSSSSSDYPIYAKDVSEDVKNKVSEFGVLVCTTGIGMSICANKVKGVRCAKVDFIKEAKASDFESAAANYEMVTTYELPAFPLNYVSSSLFQAMDTSANTALASVDTNEDFLKAAFALKLNDFSEPVLAGQDIAVLQYIGNADEEAQEPKTFADEINNFDQTSTQSVALESPKLVNNFLTVYFDNFVSNSF